MMDNIDQLLVVDFYDSFTLNIVSKCQRLMEIHHLNPDIQVCSWDKLEAFFKAGKMQGRAIIWGPGPGTVSEYTSIDPIIKNCLGNPDLFNMGICLGHQIILKNLGHNLINAKRPRHGESVPIRLPAWDIYPRKMHGKTIQVQLYNSWVAGKNIQVKEFNYLFFQEEIMGVWGKNLLTYQFHPESIGTASPEVFFLPLINKLCNNGSTSA